ncbi:MAG TPA: 4Fe-4S dicluster domain-containing protein, partial [Patescibacteria group bacterium]|nr:4Fe-4S dicluster domain-containing protein [Patescibacteria group bacterium]
MGHRISPDREYRLLQRRLDRNITGAPESPVFMRILELLFTPEEAELARRVPTRPVRLQELSRRLQVPEGELDRRLTELASKGLVFDLEYQGQRYFSLAPVVIGFFEFTFMRTDGQLPLAELARLFEEYMHGDDRFGRAVFGGQTQLARALVHEEALPAGNYNEVLDWERASRIVADAEVAALGLCACRHKAQHLGTVCAHSLETCLSFGQGAEILVRQGFARRISGTEALRVLEDSKRAGLAQIGDNVRDQVGYICNCCGCCCSMFTAMKRLHLREAVVSSNWLMAVERERCSGCGRCVQACPLEAIQLIAEQQENQVQRVQCSEELCLGCGICPSVCRSGALRMVPRPRRVFTPENTLERILQMAIERKKIANLLFEDPESLSHRTLGRIVAA